MQSVGRFDMWVTPNQVNNVYILDDYEHPYHVMGYSRKNPNRGLSVYFLEKIPGISMFVIPLEILGQAKLPPENSTNLCSLPLKIPRPKTKTNSPWFCLDYPWRFHLFFNIVCKGAQAPPFQGTNPLTQLAPLFKIFVSPPLFSVPLPFKVF